jgi:hypothetical protein
MECFGTTDFDNIRDYNKRPPLYIKESASKFSPVWVPVRADRWPNHVIACRSPLFVETWRKAQIEENVHTAVPEGKDRLENLGVYGGGGGY